MRKRILSMAVCFCMAISLLPMSALAASYEDWAAATADGVTLTEGDTVNFDGTNYTYKCDATATGIQMFTSVGETGGVMALTEACCWKAGDGYVLYNPTVESGETTSAEVTLYNAQITTKGYNYALELPYNSASGESSPVHVTVKVEGTNSLSAPEASFTLYHMTGDTTFTGGGELSITGNLSNHYCNDDPADVDAVTIEAGTKVTITNSTDSTIAGNFTVASSGSKLTITEGTTLKIGASDLTSQQPTITVKDNAVLENNGTLQMYKSLDSRIIGNISGNGVIKLDDKPYTLVGGVFYPYGGDASGGLDLSTNTPTETTYYKAGDGYAIFTPATTDPAANAKLLLHNASISMNGNTALKLGAETIIQLEGTNSITNSNTETSEGIAALNGGELPLTIQGGSGDSLTVSAWQCTRVDDLTISGGSVTMNGLVYGILTEGNVVLQNGAQVSASGGDSGAALMIGYNTPYNLTVTGGSTLTTHGYTYISGNLTVDSGSTITTQTGDEFWVNRATAITNNGTVHNNGTFVLPYSYTAAQAKATNIPGTIKLYDSENDTFKIYVDGGFYADGGKLTNSLLLTSPPQKATYYKLNSGDHDCYILFTPQSGETPATLTLHDVNNAGYLQGGIILPDTPMTLKLEGENYFSHITASNNIAISGDGLLNSKISNSNASAVLTIESGATLNARYRTETGGVTTYTIYGSYSGGMAIDQTERLVLTPGAVWTLEWGNALLFEQNTPLGNLTFGAGASIVNNSSIVLPQGTTAAQIAELPLLGTGVVVVPTSYTDGDPATWDTYTNDGIAVKIVGDGSGLDLTIGDHSGKTVEKDGYSWDGSTLTLGNAYIGGDLTVPGNATIHTTSSSSIRRIMGDAGTTMHLTFTGTAPLTINGGISAGSNGDTVTVKEDAQVTVNGYLSLGEGGDGELTVTGSGTAMKVSSSNGYAVYCQTVKVANGASLTAKAEGTDSVGVEALKPGGSVSVTGGSSLTVGCDYGVYVVDGTFTVDDSSTFTANASVAAVCVVDTTKIKPQSQTLNVPSSMLSSGTKITSAVGNTAGYGYTYWSIANSASTLTATEESNTTATLAGALGALTLKKASTGDNNNNNNSNNNNNGGSSGGGASGSSNYTLTFETGGGTAISSVSKASGTAVDLSGYKPTRDGYDFDGWYSDTALTTKVTSVTLTKSTTVYAKWTEKTAQNANPFADVADSAYYHDAVLWTVEKSVTSGTTNTAFSPDMICTRAQAVTFLWRAKGSPEPTSANCPFTDVSADAYYYKAVLWATQTGIVKGTSPTTFSPSDTVTRSQSMTFLWRAAGETTSASANPFVDVSKDAYYYNAVLWAVEKGVTKGASATSFSPDGGCTRAQIVTFLYRYMGK